MGPDQGETSRGFLGKFLVVSLVVSKEKRIRELKI